MQLIQFIIYWNISVTELIFGSRTHSRISRQIWTLIPTNSFTYIEITTIVTIFLFNLRQTTLANIRQLISDLIMEECMVMGLSGNNFFYCNKGNYVLKFCHIFELVPIWDCLGDLLSPTWTILHSIFKPDGKFVLRIYMYVCVYRNGICQLPLAAK